MSNYCVTSINLQTRSNYENLFSAPFSSDFHALLLITFCLYLVTSHKWRFYFLHCKFLFLRWGRNSINIHMHQNRFFFSHCFISYQYTITIYHSKYFVWKVQIFFDCTLHLTSFDQRGGGWGISLLNVKFFLNLIFLGIYTKDFNFTPFLYLYEMPICDASQL